MSEDGNFNLDSGILLTYADTDTEASTKVNSFTSSVTNGINTLTQQEYYEYDSIGNITGIYRLEENEKVYYNKYYYDEANQIVREDNRLGGFTSVYTYDVGGNIVSRIRYPYTEGDIQGLTATETHTYSYENPLWGDVLTAYNGQPVTYDAMGNITSLEGDTYIWTAGRQLSRIIKADNSYTDYFYDDNGQLSMYKTYKADNTLDGGAEYFWDGTELIAVRLIENDTDGMTAFMRILYDSDGEPLGFLLNDAMPFLYTKNLLGDITGVVNYENAQLMFSYAYDAYGNYELIPPDDSAASMVVATMLHALNPLTYRGYVFTPAIGISHYLGSRFYSPKLCRFMNADVYADTAQGVVGTNMFAYCNNNPVMFVDPMGTNPDTHQPLGLPELFLALSVALNKMLMFLGATAGICISLVALKEFIAYVNVCVNDLFYYLSNNISSKLTKFEDDLKKVMDKMIEKLKKIKSNKTYKTTKEKHHICAKGATKAYSAKQTLYKVGYDENCDINLIFLYTVIHKRLHTNAYYAVTNNIVVYSYELGQDKAEKTLYVTIALLSLRNFLNSINIAVEELFPGLIQ